MNLFRCVLMVGVLLGAGSVFAQDSALELYEVALAQYQQRQTDLVAFEPIFDQIKLARDAAMDEADDDLLYQVFILASRAYYWKGNQLVANSDRAPVFDHGVEAAKKAIEVNSFYAEGYYYSSINLGKWALAKGPLTVLGRKGELYGLIDSTRKAETMSGELGANIDYNGPDRVEGYAEYKLSNVPFMGSMKKSLQLLKRAYEEGRDADGYSNSLNGVYYAEVLIDDGQKKAGCAILDDLASFSGREEEYNPNRVPETTEEIATAVKMQQKECQSK